MRFFSAYDASRDINILMLKKRLAQKKKDNQKKRTFQACDYAEKTDIENLFLDCVDYCKKETFKNDNAKVGLKDPRQGGRPPKHTSTEVNTTKGDGVHFSVNGTIQAVNLNSKGRNLKQKLVIDKNALIAIFEEMFGSNKAPLFETTSGPGNMGQKDQLALTHEALTQLAPGAAVGMQ